MAMPSPDHAVTWFEIPALDLPRAQTFYETVLGRPMQRVAMGGDPMALFARDEGAVGGCLVAGSSAPPPTTNGSRVYLNAGASLDAALSRVKAAGGRVSTPSTELPDGLGFFAHITDTEGNRVGLHALA